MTVTGARDAAWRFPGGGRTFSLRVLAAGVAALVAQAWLQWPQAPRHWAWGILLNSLLVPTFLISGALLRRLPGHARNGTLLVLTAIASLVGQGLTRDVGPLPFVAYTFGVWWVVPLAALLLRWPGERLTNGQRRYVITLAVVPPVARLIDSVTWDPAWGGYHGPAWWLTLVHDRPLHDRVVVPVGEGAMALLAVVFLLLLWWHWRAARGLDRIELAPIACAAVLAALGAGADAARACLVSHDSQSRIEARTTPPR